MRLPLVPWFMDFPAAHLTCQRSINMPAAHAADLAIHRGPRSEVLTHGRMRSHYESPCPITSLYSIVRQTVQVETSYYTSISITILRFLDQLPRVIMSQLDGRGSPI